MDFNSGVCDLYSINCGFRSLKGKASIGNPPVAAHTLTSVWPSCFLRSQVCCPDYWQQNGVHATVCLGLNFRTRPHSTLWKKEEKSKFWCRLVESVVFEKNSNRINIRMDSTLDCSFYEWNTDTLILNQQKHSFSINEYISSFSDGNAWPALTVKQDTSTYNILENNTHCILFA